MSAASLTVTTEPLVQPTAQDAPDKGLIEVGKASGPGFLANVRPVFALYWTIAAVLIGVWISPVIMPAVEDPSARYTHEHSMGHGLIEADPANAPALEIRAERDVLSGWNVFLDLDNFAFTPAEVNGENRPNVGHGHVYVNGEKHGRLYAEAFHLGSLPGGDVEIMVTLNANDHSNWALNGKPIASTVTVVNPAPGHAAH
ncbi:MAG: hypothetical protein AAGH60_04835 [Pseudomonadota bacterium]